MCLQMSSNDVTREFQCLSADKLTTYNKDTGHYEISAQRSCFVRCDKCLNLSEADSHEVDGEWAWARECLFCVSRVVDMLGYYEHGIVPALTLHDTPKTRKRDDPNNLYQLLERVAKSSDFGGSDTPK